MGILRKGDQFKKEVKEEWLLTYSDSVTLLMAFFVILLSISTIDQSKVEQLESGLSQVFFKKEKEMPFMALKKKMEEVTVEKNLQKYVVIVPDPLGLKVKFSSNLLFDIGEAEIKKAMIPVLQDISSAIKTSQYQGYLVKIEGHTDDVPIRTERYPSNWELSAARATTVVRQLIKFGIPQTKLKASGFADSRPIQPNIVDGKANYDNRATNRRVVMYIHREKN